MSKARTFYFSFIDDATDNQDGPHLISRERWQIDLHGLSLHVIVFTPLGAPSVVQADYVKQEIIRVYGRLFSTN